MKTLQFFKNPYYEDIRIAIIDLDQRELSGNLTILYDVRYSIILKYYSKCIFYFY